MFILFHLKLRYLLPTKNTYILVCREMINFRIGNDDKR